MVGTGDGDGSASATGAGGGGGASGFTATVRTRRGSPNASKGLLPGVVVPWFAGVPPAARAASATSRGCSSRFTILIWPLSLPVALRS